MKRLFTIFSSSILIIGTTSCYQTVENFQGEEPLQVQFVSRSECIQTRMQDSQWTDGDRVGIYMKESGLPLSATSVYPGSANIGYTTDSNGNMAPETGTLYFPGNGEYVDFIAYYPYKENISGLLYPVDISNQAGSDLLYADNAQGFNKGDSSVNLNFRHVMCRLVFTLIMGDGAPGTPGDYNVSLGGFSSTADFSLIDGTFSNQNVPVSTVGVGIPQANTLTLFILPTIPENETARFIEFTKTESPANTVRWNIPSETLFEEGYTYQYDLTLNLQATTRSSSQGQGTAEAILREVKKTP